jgi:SAM-dependent methyltransferase
MNWLKQFKEKVRQYRGWKKSNTLNRYGFIPSITHVKYPPNYTFKGKRVLNLGCGGSTYKATNVVNTDLHAGPGVNVVCDLSKTPLPFADNSFDLIIANHVLEHVPNWWKCFEELCRIIDLNGVIEVWIPPISSEAAFSYRDHINYINVESFMGIQGFNRPGTNLDASKNNLKTNSLHKVVLFNTSARPAVKWWIWFAPQSILSWLATYLRHIISEEGFFFRKVEK